MVMKSWTSDEVLPAGGRAFQLQAPSLSKTLTRKETCIKKNLTCPSELLQAKGILGNGKGEMDQR